MDDHSMIEYIDVFTNDHGYPPTQRELGLWFRVSERAVRNRLRKLADAGEVTWTPGTRRTVRVVSPRANAKAVVHPV